MRLDAIIAQATTKTVEVKPVIILGEETGITIAAALI